MTVTAGSGAAVAAEEASPYELTAGSTLNGGQFEITKFLASGGFGITYLARDSLDRVVVIKECYPAALCHRSGSYVLPTSSNAATQFEAVVQLFVREAKAMSKLVHPNIVGIHQVFEENGTAYMALDYVDGCDLLGIIEDETFEVSPDRLVLWLRKILGAIEFIHGHDVLHRDIAPDNILLDKHDNPLLIDFGAVREQATRASRALTTLRVVKDGYSPQEFYVQGAAQNRSSDLYALGATFYHLLDGDPPPDSQERIAALAEGRDDPYRPLEGRVEGYSAAVLRSVDLALRILPAERLQSAREWLDLIDAAGPFVQPAPLDFDFDAIRSEVARIAEELEEIEEPEPLEAQPARVAAVPDAEPVATALPEPAPAPAARRPRRQAEPRPWPLIAAVAVASVLTVTLLSRGDAPQIAPHIAAIAVMETGSAAERPRRISGLMIE